MRNLCMTTPSFGFRDPYYDSDQICHDNFEVKKMEKKGTLKNKRLVKGLTFTGAIEDFKD